MLARMFLHGLTPPRLRWLSTVASKNTTLIQAEDLPLASTEELFTSLSTDVTDLLDAAGLDGVEISVTLCSDAFIHQLNREHLGCDYPTDVLSFPLEHEVLLGDLVISVETARRAASTPASSEYCLTDEIRVLLVHGFLHLRGFDHEEEEAFEEMRLEEQRMLEHLGWRGVGLIQKSTI
jgi:probable rRNA maturation factor